MGTNYYAVKRTTKEERENLKKMIDLSENGLNYREIIDEVERLYGRCDEYERDSYMVHLGKNSYGWKFLWNPNTVKRDLGHYDVNQKKWIPRIRYVKKYELTKEGIRDFVMQDDIFIINEYNEIQDKEEFLNFAFNSEGLDSSTYEPEGMKFNMRERQEMWKRLGYKFKDKYSSDFESDGLRFSTSIEFS